MQVRTDQKSSKTPKVRADEASATFSRDALLTPQHLSKRWNITALTLRRDRDQGKLRAVVISPRISRFSMSEILRFEAQAAE